MKIYEIAIVIICINAGIMVMNALGVFGVSVNPAVNIQMDYAAIIRDLGVSIGISTGVALLTRYFAPQATALSFYGTFIASYGPMSVKSTIDTFAGIIENFPTTIGYVIVGITTIICVIGAIQIVSGGWRGYY